MPDDPTAPQTPPPQPTEPLATPPGAPPVPGETSTGLTPNVAAGIAVLFSLVSGIVFLIIEKRSQFVRFWAMQSTIFGLLSVAISIVMQILVHIIGALVVILSSLCSLALLIGWVLMLYYAFTGKEWELPVLGKIARQQLVKFPPQP